jgi:peptide deformylase
MDTLEIITFPNKLLKQPTQSVDNIDETIQKLIDGMAATMCAAPGVGLAAIQVGVDKSIIVFDESLGNGEKSLKTIINPRIVCQEGSVVSENEGCLSVPDFRADVKRCAAVEVEGIDREGKPVKYARDDFLAVVLQHEIDHLNGILFIDHLSTLKRQLYTRRVMKQQKKADA